MRIKPGARILGSFFSEGAVPCRKEEACFKEIFMILSGLVALIPPIIKGVEEYLRGLKSANDRDKARKQIEHHTADVKMVGHHLDHTLLTALAQKNLGDVGKVQNFIRDKQGKLAGRCRLPDDMKSEGKQFYKDAMVRTEEVKKRILSD